MKHAVALLLLFAVSVQAEVQEYLPAKPDTTFSLCEEWCIIKTVRQNVAYNNILLRLDEHDYFWVSDSRLIWQFTWCSYYGFGPVAVWKVSHLDEIPEEELELWVTFVPFERDTMLIPCGGNRDFSYWWLEKSP